MPKTFFDFIQRNQSGSFEKPDDDFFNNYSEIFPQEITSIYRSLGFGFCERKLIQIVNSADYFTVLYEFGISILDNAVFAITALGDLLIYQKEPTDTQAPGLYIYSIHDMTCTRLSRPQDLSEWLGQSLDLSGFDNYDRLPDASQNALLRALYALGLGDYFFSARKTSAYALESGKILANPVYEALSGESDPDALIPFDALSYIQDLCQAYPDRNEDNAIPFKLVPLDEKLDRAAAKHEAARDLDNAQPEEADPYATIAMMNPVLPQAPAFVEQAQAATADQTASNTDTQAPAPLPGDMPEQPVIAPLFNQPVNQPQAPQFAQPQVPLTYNNLQPLVDTILQRLRPLRFENSIQFEPYQHGIDILENKLGGAFYIPADKQPPRNKQTGAELSLLAQLNFAQLPKMKDFPEDGLLQFFVDPDPVAFRNSFHPTQQISWRVRFIPHSPSHSEIPFLNGYMPAVNTMTSVTTLPFTPGSVLSLAAHDMPHLTAWEDFPFKAMLSRHCADLMPQNPTPEQVGLLRAARDMVKAALEPECKPGRMKDEFIQIGGHPTFKHPDPRNEDPRFPGIRTPAVLLLQIPSIDRWQLRWANEDVAHFFISRKDLRDKNFNNVMFDV